MFGNLELEKLSVTVDPNDVLAKPAGSSDPVKKVAGAITTPLLAAHPLTGPVELLEAPAAPTGVTLSDAAAVDAGFSTWGTVSANAKIALVAGTTSLVAGTPAGTVLSTGNLAAIDVHAAAAYDAADARAVKLAVMDATGGYELTVNLKAVTSKTLDVTAPVESGASFELSPDGKLHENVMANQASVLNVIVGPMGDYTPEEIEAMLKEKVDAGMIAFSINTQVVMESPDAEAPLLFENPGNNAKLLKLELTRDDTGQSIYETGFLEPGTYVSKDKLDVQLDPGSYTCTATISAYREDTRASLGKAAAEVVLVVLEDTNK